MAGPTFSTVTVTASCDWAAVILTVPNSGGGAEPRDAAAEARETPGLMLPPIPRAAESETFANPGESAGEPSRNLSTPSNGERKPFTLPPIPKRTNTSGIELPGIRTKEDTQNGEQAQTAAAAERSFRERARELAGQNADGGERRSRLGQWLEDLRSRRSSEERLAEQRRESARLKNEAASGNLTEITGAEAGRAGCGSRRLRRKPETPKLTLPSAQGKMDVLWTAPKDNGGWKAKYTDTFEAMIDALNAANPELYAAYMSEGREGNTVTPLVDAVTAAAEDVRQGTISPMAGAELVNQMYSATQDPAVRRAYLSSLYNAETGNLLPQAVRRASSIDEQHRNGGLTVGQAQTAAPARGEERNEIAPAAEATGAETGNGVADGGRGGLPGQRAGEPDGRVAKLAEARSAVSQFDTASRRRSDAKNLPPERVNARDHIAEAAEGSTLTFAPEQMVQQDKELRTVKRRLESITGRKVYYTLGGIKRKGANGKTGTARGAITPNGIYLRCDDDSASVTQLAGHELYHYYEQQFPGLHDRVRQRITERYSEEEFRKIAGKYAEKLGRLNGMAEDMDAEAYEAMLDRIESEIFADAFGNINYFRLGADRFTDAAREAVNETLGRETAAATERRTGPPETRFSTQGEVLARNDVDWMENDSSIKSQLREHAKEINYLQPVATVDYVHNPKESIIEIITKAVSRIGGGRMKNSGVEFVFDKEGIESINTHATGAELRAAALAAPYVAKYGKLIAGQKNHENTGLTTLTFAAPVEINGTIANVGVVVQFQQNGRPRAVNVGLQDGGKFKIKEASRGTSSRVDQYSQGTSLDTRDASEGRIAEEKPDVKTSFSMSEDADADYMAAVEAGDMETARRMVDEAAEAAGYTIRAYHGTGSKFTVFDKSKIGSTYSADSEGFFFSSEKEVAEYAASDAAYQSGEEERVLESYLRMDDPLELTAKEDPANYYDKNQSGILQMMHDMDHDGIIIHGKDADMYVVLDSEQVKSADPVTYDDEGNVIPLSERFNAENEDIRYSREMDLEAYKDKKLSEDPSLYTYGFLTARSPMRTTELPDLDTLREGKKVQSWKVVASGVANATANGTVRDGKIYVENDYTGRELRVDVATIRHGLCGEKNRLLTNSRMGAVIGEMVQHGIPINALKNKADGVSGTYAMAAYAYDQRGREFIGIITVEQRSGDIDDVELYDVAHSVSGRQKIGQKNSDQAGTKPQGVYPIKVAEISIAQLLDIVNSTHQSILSDDVLKNLGETRNPNGEYTGKAKFSIEIDPEVAAMFSPEAVARREQARGRRSNPNSKRRVSKVRSNTYEVSGLFSEVGAQMEEADPGNYEYDPISEKRSMNEARSRLKADFDGEVSRLSDADHAWGGSDLDTAMGILHRYRSEGRATGDYTDFWNWSKTIQEKGTKGGQFIQAFAKYTRTGTGQAQKAAENLRKQYALNPAQQKRVNEHKARLLNGIEEDAQDAADGALQQAKGQRQGRRKAKPGEVQRMKDAEHLIRAIYGIFSRRQQNHGAPVGSWIDMTGEELAKRIASRSNTRTTPQRTAMQTILSDLVGFAEEHALPERQRAEGERRTAIDTITDYLSNRDAYGAAWAQAQAVLRAQYADQEKLDALEGFLGATIAYNAEGTDRTMLDAILQSADVLGISEKRILERASAGVTES